MERKEQSQSEKKPEATSNSIEIEEKDQPKKAKKRIRISSILTMVGVMALGAFSGTVIGLWFKSKKQSDSQTSIDSGVLKKVEEEKAQVALKWANAQTSKQNYYEIFSPLEMVQVALLNLETDDYIAECFGKTKPSSFPKQDITSIKARFGETAYFENISYGTKKIGRRYFENEEKIIWYEKNALFLKGNDAIYDTPIYLATYKDGKKEMTSAEYEETFGNPLKAASDYIISSYTLEENYVPQKEEKDEKIIVNLNLSDEACMKYKKKIKATESMVSKVNLFEFVHLTFTLSKDLKMQEIYVEEKYNMQIGLLDVTATADLRSIYYYDVKKDDLPTSVEEYQFRGDIKQ